MKKMLHISPNEYPPLYTEHSTKRIWEELSRGFDEYHIVARAKDNKFHNYCEKNIFLHLVPKLGKSRSFFLSSILMIKIIHKYKINYMLSQCPLLGGFWAIIYKKIFKIPLMIEIHGLEYFRILDSNKILNKLLSKIIMYSLKNATKVRSLSSKMTKMLKNRDIVANIVIIYNRVDIALFNNPKMNNDINNIVKVVSVGRFVWEKGYDNAIKVIKNMQQKYKIELTLIGGGKLYKQYKELIGTNRNIKLIEDIPQKDLVTYLNNADIYIQPSLSEGMPRTILEAMAIRLPIIASNVGAIEGIIKNKENGLLIKPDSIKELEKAIEELIENSQLRKSIANNGYIDVITKYEWNKMFEIYRNEILKMGIKENRNGKNR